MLKLEDIKKDAQVRGIQVEEIVRIIQVEPVGEAALTVYYKDSQGKLGEQMLFREEDFQIWLSQLDGDRFYGKFREGAHKVDVSDMMRRMVKEELFKFDGTKLFPERKAYTANYQLSPLEASLYEQVTTPFTMEPDFGVASINYDLKDLLSKAVEPESTL